MPISKERLAEIEAIPDDQIDTTDIPELDTSFFEKARLTLPEGTPKKPFDFAAFREDVLRMTRENKDNGDER